MKEKAFGIDNTAKRNTFEEKFIKALIYFMCFFLMM
jgi:hypothetical protein